MPTQEVLCTEDLPAADRFGAWCEAMSRTHAPMQMSSRFAAEFRARQRRIYLSEVTVYPVIFQQTTFRRTPKLIRQSDPEGYNLSFLLSGEGGAVWDQQEANYRPYDFHTSSTSRQYETWGGLQPVSMIGVEIPRSLLPVPRRHADQVIGRHMSGRDGIGALLGKFLTQLARDTACYQSADAPRLCTVLVDLVAALFAHTFDTDGALAPETRSRTLLLQIKAFIRRHLADPGLTPGQVAAAHHISRSYLHRLFQHEDTTVAAYIRHQRLEAARRDLTDPAQQAIPIHAIAARWGYLRAADFTRAFRAAYGASPSDLRRESVAGYSPGASSACTHS